MSSNKLSKKKVVTTTQSTKKIRPTASKSKTSTSPKEMLFGRENYKWMIIGAVLVALGLIMMIGGSMDDPNVWDESVIYSFRITVIGPILILAGLVTEIYAIFK